MQFWCCSDKFGFCRFPNFSQNGNSYTKWDIFPKMRKSGNIWENLISCFRIFWENMGKSFLEVNLWWEILRNFGIFREIIISSLRIFVEILFWDILGNNRKNIPNGKIFSRSLDKMGNLLMRNFGKIWDYSGKLVEVNLWWDILRNFGIFLGNHYFLFYDFC